VDWFSPKIGLGSNTNKQSKEKAWSSVNKRVSGGGRRTVQKGERSQGSDLAGRKIVEVGAMADSGSAANEMEQEHRVGTGVREVMHS